VPARESGFLKELKVELNQTVSAGELLAALDDDLAASDLRLAKLMHTFAVQEAMDDETIKYRQRALERAEQVLAKHLAISNSVSESEIRDYEFAVVVAKHELAEAQKSKRMAEYQLQRSREAVTSAESRLAHRNIEAPMAGIVTDVKVHAGQAVEAGQPLFEIRNLEVLTVDRLIPIEQIPLSRIVGAEVRVDVVRGAGPVKRLSGTITSYDPEVSSQGLVRIHARVTNIRDNGAWVLLDRDIVTMHIAMGRAGD
jgi:multidrug efflux pump subunit AcrA (membrane-fusion protein)